MEPSRRAVLSALPRTALAAFLLAIGLGRAGPVVRPPGALPPERFLASCVRCTRCVDVCPTGAIAKVGAEGWPRAYGTPVLAGRCLFWDGCRLCVDACPTGALEPFDPATVRLGTAAISEGTCYVHRGERPCFVCQEFCPFKAVHAVAAPGRPPPYDVVPVISASECTGCYFCHDVCPTTPKAITVSPVVP